MSLGIGGDRATMGRASAARGAALLSGGDLAGASAAYQHAFALSPTDSAIAFQLGYAHQLNGELEDAAADYETSLYILDEEKGGVGGDDDGARLDSMAGVLFNYAAALEELGRADEAVDASLRLLTLVPEYPGARNNLGIMLYRQGKLADSEAVFRDIVRANPGDVTAARTLAMMQAESGNGGGGSGSGSGSGNGNGSGSGNGSGAGGEEEKNEQLATGESVAGAEAAEDTEAARADEPRQDGATVVLDAELAEADEQQKNDEAVVLDGADADGPTATEMADALARVNTLVIESSLSSMELVKPEDVPETRAIEVVFRSGKDTAASWDNFGYDYDCGTVGFDGCVVNCDSRDCTVAKGICMSHAKCVAVVVNKEKTKATLKASDPDFVGDTPALDAPVQMVTEETPRQKTNAPRLPSKRAPPKKRVPKTNAPAESNAPAPPVSTTCDNFVAGDGTVGAARAHSTESWTAVGDTDDALFSKHAYKPGEGVYVFVHIPKCAGSQALDAYRAVTAPAVEWFPPAQVNSFGAPGCGTMPMHGSTHCGLAELEDCWAGGFAQHVQKSQVKKVPQRTSARSNKRGSATKRVAPKPTTWPADTPRRYVTILRHPVERVVSEYFWWHDICREAKGFNAWPQQACAAAQFSIEHWVRSEYNNAHNRQTKYLARMDHAAAPSRDKSIECASFFAPKQQTHWREVYGAGWDGCLEAMINQDTSLAENAVAVLRSRFLFVGIQEAFDESIALFGKLAADGVPRSAAAASKSKKAKGIDNRHGSIKKPVSEETTRLILEKNAQDMALYGFAVKRFVAAAEANGVRLANSDKLLKSIAIEIPE